MSPSRGQRPLLSSEAGGVILFIVSTMNRHQTRRVNDFIFTRRSICVQAFIVGEGDKRVMLGTRITVLVYLPSFDDPEPPGMSFADAVAANTWQFPEQLTRATAVNYGVTGPTAVVIPMAGVSTMTTRLPTRAASTALGRFQGMHASSGRFHRPYLLTATLK